MDGIGFEYTARIIMGVLRSIADVNMPLAKRVFETAQRCAPRTP